MPVDARPLAIALRYTLAGAAAFLGGSWLIGALAHVDDGRSVDHVAGTWMALATAANAGTLYPPFYEDGYYGGTRFAPLPIVLQAHELPPPGPKTSATIRYAAGIADVLVGVSDAVADLLRRHAGSTPVLTVRNGVPEPVTRARSDDAPFTVGSVATVSRTKGTDVFLRAARIALAERPGLRFEHVGAPDLHADSGLDLELELLAGEITPADRLAMLGYRPAAEVLPGWHVFVCSSRSEAFPLATLEAMALGIPVIATTVGGLPEQIEHLESGILVRPDDPEAIATWLVRLHDDADLRTRLGAAAAERVRREFTLERQANGLHRAYLTALNLRFAPPSIRRATRSAA